MSRPFQFRLHTMLLLMAAAGLAVQLAMLAGIYWSETLMIARGLGIMALCGLLWIAPFLPAIVKRRG